MVDLNIIRDKVKFHIRDTKVSDGDIDNIIMQIISDVANNTSIFKKIYGFTVHKDMNIYDFESLTYLNEDLEIELKDVFIPIVASTEDVNKDTFLESDGISEFIRVATIFDDKGKDITDKFKFKGTKEYYVQDEEWLEYNDMKTFAFVAVVLPAIEELRDYDLMPLMSCIIEGVKYYVNNTYTSHEDIQSANLYYKRYFAKQKELINHSPEHVYSTTSYKTQKLWL